MSIEICKICQNESTPYFHVNGHICEDCYYGALENSNHWWRKVEDELPPIETPVLIWTPKENTIEKAWILLPENRGETYSGAKCFWFAPDNFGWSEEEVTHWMPLPEKPE